MDLPTIVMIDCSPEATEMVRFALWKNNLRCNFLVYPDAPTATRCMLQQRRRSSDGPAPALVLLESDLDYTDGLDLLRQMRADVRFATVPVVVFPSHDMEGEAAAMASGATQYTPKPIDAEIYSQCIVAFYQRWCAPKLGATAAGPRAPRAIMPPAPPAPPFTRRRSDRVSAPLQ